LFDELGMDVSTPDGAFYLMLPVDDDSVAQSASNRSSGDQPRDQQWCQDALEDAHVATVPGSAFGAPGYARLSYAASTERLEEAVERLADAGYL
jgi:aspartate aminotransferase